MCLCLEERSWQATQPDEEFIIKSFEWIAKIYGKLQIKFVKNAKRVQSQQCCTDEWPLSAFLYPMRCELAGSRTHTHRLLYMMMMCVSQVHLGAHIMFLHESYTLMLSLVVKFCLVRARLKFVWWKMIILLLTIFKCFILTTSFEYARTSHKVKLRIYKIFILQN